MFGPVIEKYGSAYPEEHLEVRSCFIWSEYKSAHASEAKPMRTRSWIREIGEYRRVPWETQERKSDTGSVRKGPCSVGFPLSHQFIEQGLVLESAVEDVRRSDLEVIRGDRVILEVLSHVWDVH